MPATDRPRTRHHAAGMRARRIRTPGWRPVRVPTDSLELVWWLRTIPGVRDLPQCVWIRDEELDVAAIEAHQVVECRSGLSAFSEGHRVHAVGTGVFTPDSKVAGAAFRAWRSHATTLASRARAVQDPQNGVCPEMVTQERLAVNPAARANADAP
jgi:hypothetical protein